MQRLAIVSWFRFKRMSLGRVVSESGKVFRRGAERTPQVEGESHKRAHLVTCARPPSNLASVHDQRPHCVKPDDRRTQLLLEKPSRVLRNTSSPHSATLALIMAFGEIVCGSPGSGKSTYCYGKHQLFTALQRPIAIVNLDPANENIPYPCAINIADLITVEDAMDEHHLGPNGGMLYCMEYLEANIDWLEGKLAELQKDVYVVFDLPGQVEVSTNHLSVKRIVEKLGKAGLRVSDHNRDRRRFLKTFPRSVSSRPHVRRPLRYRRCQIHLCAFTIIADYASPRATSCQRPIQGRPDHKVRRAWYESSPTSPVTSFTVSSIAFNLDFYTQVQDLSYLSEHLEASLPPQFAALNMAIVSLVEDFGLVGFETLAVEVLDLFPHQLKTS